MRRKKASTRKPPSGAPPVPPAISFDTQHAERSGRAAARVDEIAAHVSRGLTLLFGFDNPEAAREREELTAVLGRLVFGSRTQHFGDFPFRGPGNRRAVALTFDDGPNEPYTSRLLDVLAEREARATFFDDVLPPGATPVDSGLLIRDLAVTWRTGPIPDGLRRGVACRPPA